VKTVVLFIAAALAARADDIALLNLRVVEGEGSVYAVGSRATRGITVEITDEFARPVAGASVSFMLPESGASGVFPGGKRTEVGITNAEGKASVWGMQWNKSPGTVEVRITALKGSVRAGTISTQYISDKLPTSSANFSSSHKRRYLIIGAAVAGAAVAGLAFHGSGSGTSAQAPAAVVAPPSIGNPTITIGKP
jgi:hypothetical protein